MIRFLLLFTLFLTSWTVSAQDMPTPTPSVPSHPFVIPEPPKIAAKAYLLIDYNSGYVLAAKNAHKRIEPASLTKIMTGYVVINELKNGSIKLTDKVTISPKAWKMPGSKMFIEVGKKVSVKNLIKGMVVQSGNDASVALAEHVAGSESAFVDLMNQYAKKLGMTHTHFADATGLPNPNHYTTASDLATLTKALITNFPVDYTWYAQKKFTFNGITQYNRNKLLWQDPSVDGLKTGHTKTAGYCLIGSAKRHKMRLISVVLGTSSARMRVQESQKLLNFGFRFFETHKLYSGMSRLNDARVWEGNRDSVGLGLKKDLYITIPRGQYKNLKITSTINANIKAPIKNLQPLGTLTVSLGDKVLAKRPLIALGKIEEGSFYRKLMDQLKQFINSFIPIFD